MNQLIKIQASYREQEYFQKVLLKKRKQYILFNKKYEKLCEEIQKIQDEYDRRIGVLLRKISIIDYEIERYRQASSLVRRGLDLGEALEVVDEEIKRKYTKEKEEMWEYLDLFEKQEVISEDMHTLIRRLWKKLAQRYHPDLTDDSEDKKKREQIMKHINNAYAQKNLDALKALEEKELEIDSPQNLDLENIEKILVSLENALIRIQKATNLLKKSEWYPWRKKTTEEKKRLFLDLESNFLREIVRKEFTLFDLKKKFN